jgi:hypothetical protein
MFDFNLIIKALISASILYLVVNSIWRFHVLSHISAAFGLFAGLIILIVYSDLAYSFTFVILLGIIYLISWGIILFSKIKKRHYYLLLNVGKSGYHRVRYYLILNAKEGFNYVYNKKTFFLIKFFDNDVAEQKKIVKGLETLESKRRKQFTMINYWQIIIFIVMMIVLWRF